MKQYRFKDKKQYHFDNASKCIKNDTYLYSHMML